MKFYAFFLMYSVFCACFFSMAQEPKEHKKPTQKKKIHVIPPQKIDPRFINPHGPAPAVWVQSTYR